MGLFGNLFKETYTDRERKRQTQHKVYYIKESCGVCGVDTSGVCKNCEEYSYSDHKMGYEGVHGKWKEESNQWKKYIKPSL